MTRFRGMGNISGGIRRKYWNKDLHLLCGNRRCKHIEKKEREELIALHIIQTKELKELKSSTSCINSLLVLDSIEKTLDRFYFWQSINELFWIFNHIERIKPSVIVEVGCYTGGTIDIWDRYSQLAGCSLQKIIGIDLDIKRILLRKSLKPITVLLKVDSSSLEARRKLDEALVSQNIDFGFIDGSHIYEDVKSDFELLWPRIRPGGALAFHDIKWSGNQVGRFWQTLVGEKYQTLHQYGIGLIYKTSIK